MSCETGTESIKTPTLSRKTFASASGPACRYLFQLVQKWSDSIDMARPIVDHLYLGTVKAAQDLQWRARQNITHILTVMTTRGISGDIPEKAGCERKIIAVEDLEWERLYPHFAPCCAWIEKAIANGGNVLVHCRMGVSRSATMVIAYLQETLQFGWMDAYRFVQSKRNVIEPNSGFQTQLKEWDHYLADCRSHPEMQALHAKFRNSTIVLCVLSYFTEAQE